MSMNKQIRYLGVFLILCYLALFVKMNQIQIFQADDLAANPNNRRIVQREYNRARGAITTADGALLAQSVDAGDEARRRQRVYPEKDLFGQITGYFSLTYGATGVEKSYNDELSGSTVQQQIRGLADLFSNQETIGNVTLSLRKDLQTTARDALKDPRTGADREGSVVLMDPKTGEILAFWSYPSFDPNLLSLGTFEDQQQAWALLNLAPGKPLQAKQYQERYFPGSTFKVVTSGIGLQTGKVTDTDPVYPVETFYQPPQTSKKISNFGGESCGGPLPEILKFSCNSAFARMGTETITGQPMLDGAQAFGFNKDVPIDLPSPAQSNFPTNVTTNPPVLAQASIGQNDVQSTPLQMAMVASAVANKGVMMKPHVMHEVRDGEGRVVKTYDPEQWLAPMDAEHAATLRADMLGVVTGGTGTPAQVAGYEVGGKTGTAQLGDGRVHTWMMAMAGLPGQDPQLAISVVVLNQNASNSDNTGGQIAGPVAKAVLTKALDVINHPTPNPPTTSSGGTGTGGTGTGGPGGATPGGPPSTAPKRTG